MIARNIKTGHFSFKRLDKLICCLLYTSFSQFSYRSAVRQPAAGYYAHSVAELFHLVHIVTGEYYGLALLLADVYKRQPIWLQSGC